MKRAYSIGLTLLLLFLAACGQGEEDPASGEVSEESGQLNVYTTLYPLQYFTERIGGEHVKVNSILPAGSNPHTFEPTTKMMVNIAESDAFIYNGAGLESYAKDISESIKGEDVSILEASEGVELLEHVHDHDDHANEESSHSDENHEEHEHASHSDENHEGHEHEASEDQHADEEHDHEASEDQHADEEHDHEASEDQHANEGHEHEASEEHHTGEAEEEHDHEGAKDQHSEENHEGHDEASHEEHDHEEAEGENHNHQHGDNDPHVWLDPIRAITIAENIKDQLTELNPEAKEDFQANFESLKDELVQLDYTFHEKLESADTNKILVSHAAYGYWEKAYGIEQIAIAGLSPTNEPSQKQVEKIIEKSKEYNIDTILFEQNVTPKVSEVIRKEIGADMLRLHNISVLTDEDLENDEDYFTLMNHNLDVLLEVLNK